MIRRDFLKYSVATSATLSLASWTGKIDAPDSPFVSARNKRVFPVKGGGTTYLKADLVIAGGGTGGCAAALAAAKMGQKVIMTEETDWIGGQLTSQGVPPDEHRWIETMGCTQLYRSFRNGVRAFYNNHLPLTEQAGNNKTLNPGSGHVSRICHDPRIGLAVLYQMMMPYFLNEQITILYNHQVIGAETKGDRISTFTFVDLESGNRTTAEAPYFIDATELGDALPIANVEYVTGAESKDDTGETHAVDGPAEPLNMQAISHCFVMDYLPGEDHTIEKPKDYNFWENYVPDMTPPWSGKMLSASYSHHITREPVKDSVFLTKPDGSLGGQFFFRQIADREHFMPGFLKSNSTLVNWPNIDYLLNPILEISKEEVKKALDEAKQLSLSFLYWMQTACPRHDDKGTGYPGLKLRKDVFGTEDGLAKYPYIRESRRIKGQFRVLEQHVSAEENKDLKISRPFFDSCGIGYYRIDLHPSTGGNNYIDLPSLPFEIPLGSLIPERVENLIVASKNIASTHITNGVYRLHPVEWNIGESAGYLVAFCNRKGVPPAKVRNNKELLSEFQQHLVRQGVEIRWEVSKMGLG